MDFRQSGKVYDCAAPFIAQQVGIGDGHLYLLTEQRAKELLLKGLAAVVTQGQRRLILVVVGMMGRLLGKAGDCRHGNNLN